MYTIPPRTHLLASNVLWEGREENYSIIPWHRNQSQVNTMITTHIRMLAVHVAKMLYSWSRIHYDMVSYLFWNTVTVWVLRVKAVCSGSTTAPPITSATFSWNTLLLISNVPFNETDSGVNPACVHVCICVSAGDIWLMATCNYIHSSHMYNMTVLDEHLCTPLISGV